jgi:GNAT superfamily N-acetyltransferase
VRVLASARVRHLTRVPRASRRKRSSLSGISDKYTTAPGGVHVKGYRFHPPHLVAVEEDCGGICYEGFKFVFVKERHGFPPQFASIEAGVGRVRSMLNAPSISGVVAETEGKIAGFAFLTERDPVRAIGPIVVDPSVLSRGIGRRLREALSKRARGANSIRLVQAGFNLQSLSLYANLGFDVKEQMIVMTGRPRRSAAKGYSIRHLEEKDVAVCEALHTRILGYERSNELRDRLADGSAIVVVHTSAWSGISHLPRVSPKITVSPIATKQCSRFCPERLN